MCKLRKLYLRYHPPVPAAPVPEPEDDFAGCEIWEEADGEWLTNLPPPPGFDGFEEGEPGDEDYRRSLTGAEAAIADVTEEQLAAERTAMLAERLAREGAVRNRFFGFTPAPDEPPPPLDPFADTRHSSESWNPPSFPKPDARHGSQASETPTPARMTDSTAEDGDREESRRDDRPEGMDEAPPPPEPSGPRIRLLD